MSADRKRDKGVRKDPGEDSHPQKALPNELPPAGSNRNEVWRPQGTLSISAKRGDTVHGTCCLAANTGSATHQFYNPEKFLNISVPQSC